MKILGLDVYCHDGSACLVEDGQVRVAISEERLTREKHCRGFLHATKYCLDAAGLSVEDLDVLCLTHPYLGDQDGDRKYRTFELEGRRFVLGEDLRFVNHYTCHASSAFYTSGFEEALVYVIDGHGSDGNELVTQGFYRADTSGIKCLYSRPNHLPALDVGFIYESISYHLGFENEEFDAGKVMGLSAYGTPDTWREPLYEVRDGHIVANPNYCRYYDVVRNTTRHMRNLGPRRNHGQPIEQIHRDVAAFVQRESERVVIDRVRSALYEHPSSNLCVAGGVAMNGLIMSKLRNCLSLKDVYVPPMPNDAGTAVGAALWGSANLVPTADVGGRITTAAWGRAYDTTNLAATAGVNVKSMATRRCATTRELLDSVAKALADGAVIGWMQGGAEFGPRALGQRSILSDARSGDMKHRVNARVKRRESFRPFAPAVLSTHTRDYFEFEGPSRFMAFIAAVTDRARREVPAVVHEDGTARLQTVHAETDGLFYQLIEAFHQLTGVPVLLNTSFNLAGEPIVETVADAVSTFVRSEMDLLVIGEHLLVKNSSPLHDLAPKDAPTRSQPRSPAKN